MKRLQQLRELNLSKQLRKLLGQSSRFRFNQEEVLQAIIDRKSPIILISPTASGKSLYFQLPASLDFLGVTIVILPLLSLLQDQLARAKALNIVATIFSPRSPPDSAQLVFTTPETSLETDFQNFLSRLRQFKRLDRIVIDECHVVLNTRQTFRKQLGRLGDLIGNNTQIILLTATLPPRYEARLFNTLYLSPEKIVKYRLPSNRSNIRYSVYQNQSEDEILETIRRKDAQYSTNRLIVYTRTIKDANQLAKTLDWPVYHSKSSGREKVLRKFLNPLEKSQRIVGTTSIGSGLDISNIRAIIHVNRPYSLREYAQETGRAGRDGQKSEAILLLSSSHELPVNRSRDKDDIFEENAITEYIQPICRRHILNTYQDGEEYGSCDMYTDFICDRCGPEGSGKLLTTLVKSI